LIFDEELARRAPLRTDLDGDVMQLLSERGDIALPRGQKIVAILLFEDLLIVPLPPRCASATSRASRCSSRKASARAAT
jgi:hypothetical protein